MQNHKKFIRETFKNAKESADRGDYPHGALIVCDDKIISRGYEWLKSENDAVNGHAEIDAIRKAQKTLGQPYLKGCTLYSAAEPCPMCASAAFWAKIDTVVWSTSREDMIEEMDKKKDGNFSWRQIVISADEIFKKGIGHEIKTIPGVLREEGKKLFDLPT